MKHGTENLDGLNFTGYEIQPVAWICEATGDPVPYHWGGTGYFEAQEQVNDTVSCYGVYAHFTGSGMRWVGDYLTENQAKRAVKRRLHLLEVLS